MDIHTRCWVEDERCAEECAQQVALALLDPTPEALRWCQGNIRAFDSDWTDEGAVGVDLLISTRTDEAELARNDQMGRIAMHLFEGNPLGLWVRNVVRVLDGGEGSAGDAVTLMTLFRPYVRK